MCSSDLLGWCVDNDVYLDEAFSGSPCASTSCGVVRGRSEGGICVTLAPTFFDGAFGDESIRTAVRAWMEDRAAAEATYGHISTWETSEVTDMSELFADSSFNEDISAWDTSGVTDMTRMFEEATSFDQDLGWCVDDGVDFDSEGDGLYFQDTFKDTPRASTSTSRSRRPRLDAREDVVLRRSRASSRARRSATTCEDAKDASWGGLVLPRDSTLFGY